MDFSPLSCLHKTNVRTPPEIKSFQRTEGLLLAHLKQTGCTEMQSVKTDKKKRQEEWREGGEENPQLSPVSCKKIIAEDIH